MPAFAREALEFAIGLIPIILGAILGMIGSVHCFRKIRRKGHRLPIAILVTIAGFLFGGVVAGFVVYSLFWQSAFNSENPSELSVFAAIGSFFFGAPVFSVALIASIATLLPKRRTRIAGKRTEWKRDQKLAYRLATFFVALFVALTASVISATILPCPSSAAPEHVPCCGPITPAGDRLAATLDSMNVESLWLAHQHVNWETGWFRESAGRMQD